MNSLAQLWYQYGAKVAAAKFGAAAEGKGSPKSSLLPTVPGTQTPAPGITPITPTPPAATLANHVAGTLSAAQVNKLGEFNLELSNRAKKKDEYKPDNGESVLGQNFTSPKQPPDSVGRAFDALVVQKNTDHLNAGNEAAFTSPGV